MRSFFFKKKLFSCGKVFRLKNKSSCSLLIQYDSSYNVCIFMGSIAPSRMTHGVKDCAEGQCFKEWESVCMEESS